MGGRYVDIGIAVCLAVAPLLPTGPRYAGFPPFAYVDLVILPLALVWVANRVRAKGGVVRPLALPVWAWHLTIAAILGAAVFGLMFENRLVSRGFQARLL